MSILFVIEHRLDSNKPDARQNEVMTTIPKKSVQPKTSAKKKGKGKQLDSKKNREKKGKKTNTSKMTGNETIHDESNETEVKEEKLLRAHTMLEREKTALSEADAKKIKINVYVKGENSKITLKDTVIQSNDNGLKLEKSKTTVGLVRPPSQATILESDEQPVLKAQGKTNTKRNSGKKNGKAKKRK